MRRWFSVVALAFGVISGQAFGQTSQPVDVDYEIEVRGRDGTWRAATQAEPCELVRYTVIGTNTGSTTLPAELVTVVGPVPEGTSFVEGSATDDDGRVTIEYSPDGESFQESPPIDGVAAVRWTLTDPMEPNATVELHYRVLVEPAAGDCPPSASRPATSGSMDQNELVQRIFSEADVVQVDCPSGLDTEVEGAFCGYTTDSFELFRSKIELLVDFDMSEHLSPITAWRLDGADTFERFFHTPAGGMGLLFIEDAIEGRGNLVAVVVQ